MVISYLNYFYFLPKLLIRKKVWQFIIGLSLAFSLVILLRVQMEKWISDSFADSEHYVYRARSIVQGVINHFFIVSFVSLLRFAADWLELDSGRKELEKEKLTAELNFLKAQVNPHFLFNTLNNLYYLAYSKSDNTTKVIAKLSQMMRYMIYDSNCPKVQLIEEIEYMQNYISLERLRLNDHIPLAFDIEGATDSIQITPLILITFLENAFKHGVSNNNNQSWIKVKLNIDSQNLVYSVDNSKVTSKPEAEEKSGIGLLNVKRRLELSYPGKHKLDFEDYRDRFFVRLTINLT